MAQALILPRIFPCPKGEEGEFCLLSGNSGCRSESTPLRAPQPCKPCIRPPGSATYTSSPAHGKPTIAPSQQTRSTLPKIVAWGTSFGPSTDPELSGNLMWLMAIACATKPVTKSGWKPRESSMLDAGPLTERIAHGHRASYTCSHRTVTVSLCLPDRHAPPTHVQGQGQGQRQKSKYTPLHPPKGG
jgi:hypothetical protein